MVVKSNVPAAHAKVAALARHSPDSAEHTEAKRELKYALSADVIERLHREVDEWPPLTAEQRRNLALLLNGGVR